MILYDDGGSINDFVTIHPIHDEILEISLRPDGKSVHLRRE